MCIPKFCIWCIIYFISMGMTTPADHLPTVRNRFIKNRYGVVMALVVKAAWVENPDNAITCTQLYGGFTYKKKNVGFADEAKDILENTTFSPEMEIRNVEVYGAKALKLYCSPLNLENLPADLVIILPGGSVQNCQDGTSVCDVIIAKQTYNSTRQEDPKQSCYTLFNGQFEIPELENLEHYFNIVVQHIYPVSYTCDPEAFYELLMGECAAEDMNPLPEVTEETNNIYDVMNHENIFITEDSTVASSSNNFVVPLTFPGIWLLLTLDIFLVFFIIRKLLKMCGFQISCLHFNFTDFLLPWMSKETEPPNCETQKVVTKVS